MAKVEWKYNYRVAPSGYRYYGSGKPKGPYDTGLAGFVENALNNNRRALILDMSNARRRGEGIVRAKSRVDTGSMRSQVTGTGDFGTDILKISFGWEPFAPFYASFQEFGTRHGITPMYAVFDAYNQVLAELKSRIAGR